jgi:hypothetical protein
VQRGGIALLEQGDEQMVGAHIIMTVVSAFLLGYSQHTPRRRVKVREQASPSSFD